MNQRGAWLAVLMSLFVAAFGFSTSYAQELAIWQGKWVKLAEKVSALRVSESGSISPVNYKGTIYMHIATVDDTTKVLHCQYYEYNDGGLNFNGDIDLRISAGSSTEFSWWTLVGPEFPTIISGQVAGRIKGKVKNGALASAAVTTVGGALYVTMDDVPTVAGISWKGSLVPESKVPPVR